MIQKKNKPTNNNSNNKKNEEQKHLSSFYELCFVYSSKYFEKKEIRLKEYENE